MTSGIFTQTPTGTPTSANLGLYGGAPTAHQTLSDGNDSTYVRVFNYALGYWEVVLSFATVTLAADEYVYRRRVHVRTGYDNNGVTGGPLVANWDIWMTWPDNSAQAPNDHYGIVAYYSQVPYELYGGWKQPKVASDYWRQTHLNTPRVHIYGYANTSSFFPRIYQVWLEREIKTLPTTTVSAPTGTQTVSTMPATFFTYNSVDGFPMSGYQVKVFSAAQYGAGGFDPATSTATWDSGVVAASSVPLAGVRPTTPLTNSTTYKSYVQVRNDGTQNPNFIPKSTWVASPTYTQNVNPAAAPSITVTADAPNAQNIITIQGNNNMLDYEAASFENTTGGWTAGTNCTVTRSTTKFQDGVASLRLSSTAGGDMTAIGPTIAVNPTTTYTARAQFAAGTSTRNVQVGIDWYTAAMGFISSSTSTSTAESGTTFPGLSLATSAVAAPGTAAFARMTVRVVATGGAAELHYMDVPSIKPGANSVWSRGGLTTTQTFDLYRSVFPYELIASGLVAPATTQNVVYKDQSVPSGYAVTYIAQAVSYDPLFPDDPLVSAFSSASSPLTLTLTDWWLSDIQEPDDSMAISVTNETFKFNEHEEMAEYNPIGRTMPLIVADVIHGLTAPLTIEFLLKADYDNFRLLRAKQKTLLLRSPMTAGEQWYVRIRDDVEYEVYNTKPDIYRTATYSVIEQDVPAF